MEPKTRFQITGANIDGTDVEVAYRLEVNFRADVVHVITGVEKITSDTDEATLLNILEQNADQFRQSIKTFDDDPPNVPRVTMEKSGTAGTWEVVDGSLRS